MKLRKVSKLGEKLIENIHTAAQSGKSLENSEKNTGFNEDA